MIAKQLESQWLPLVCLFGVVVVVVCFLFQPTSSRLEIGGNIFPRVWYVVFPRPRRFGHIIKRCHVTTLTPRNNNATTTMTKTWTQMRFSSMLSAKISPVSVFLHTNIVFLYINDFPIPIPYTYTSSCILIVDRFTNERHFHWFPYTYTLRIHFFLHTNSG